MNILILSLCIVVLVLQIVRFKINPFIAFITTSLLAGLTLGVPVDKLANTIQKGFGDMLGSITLIIIFGTCIGKLTVSSGAASVIADTVMKWTERNMCASGLMITGFIVGIPLFYSVGFILLVPLIFSVAYQFKLPKVYIAIPMLALLVCCTRISTTSSFTNGIKQHVACRCRIGAHLWCHYSYTDSSHCWFVILQYTEKY